MKTRVRAINASRDRTSVLVYVGPNQVGQTESAGNLLFSKDGWATFRELLSNGMPRDLSDPLVSFLEQFIENNHDPEEMQCDLCYMLDDEHEDNCPIVEAQKLVHRIINLVKSVNDSLILEEEKKHA